MNLEVISVFLILQICSMHTETTTCIIVSISNFSYEEIKLNQFHMNITFFIYDKTNAHKKMNKTENLEIAVKETIISDFCFMDRHYVALPNGMIVLSNWLLIW